MCNPRRVTVSTCRQVREAWEREVERAAEVVDTVTAEARVVQPLDASISGPALMALNAALARGVPGWTETEDGAFRHDVPGGHVVYDPDGRTLEIVATLSETLRSRGRVRERLSGVLEDEIRAEGEAGYYDDGYGGRTHERAETEARATAERAVDRAVRESVDRDAAAAERERDAALRARAEAEARERWTADAAARREELTRQAAAELRSVGAMTRQAFHRLIALGYRDTLVALARRRGVADGDIHRRETDDVLEIEFLLPD